MKNFLLLVLTLLSAIGISSCSPKGFDYVEQTENGRYGIAYREGKCGVYDYMADSLVTELKYDVLGYGRYGMENGVELTVWWFEIDGAGGMLSVIGESNETVEVLFPKKRVR